MSLSMAAVDPDPQKTEAPARRTEADLRQIARAFAGQCHLGAAPVYDGQDQERLDRLAALYEAAGGVSLRTTCAEPA